MLNERCRNSSCFYLKLRFQMLFHTQCVKLCIRNLKFLQTDVFVARWHFSSVFFHFEYQRVLLLWPTIVTVGGSNGG